MLLSLIFFSLFLRIVICLQHDKILLILIIRFFVFLELSFTCKMIRTRWRVSSYKRDDQEPHWSMAVPKKQVAHFATRQIHLLLIFNNAFLELGPSKSGTMLLPNCGPQDPFTKVKTGGAKRSTTLHLCWIFL